MKLRHLLTLALGITAVALNADDRSAAAAARVTVTFENSEEFTDFREGIFDSEKERANLESRFTEHLARLAAPYLAQGEKLEVHFTDIDLAGDFEPWRGPSFDRIRIVKDIYPPRMKLVFRVTDANGNIVREGERNLRDLSFMMSTSIRTHDTLRHDKDLLEDWVKREFKGARKL
jgi:hypothetical protein